ncbi:LPS assembly protein LptD [Thioclava sp. A2]|uniref:LPS-assembly protein LptD n=1 Tax=Thioclava sp. FCG-A2 TaxID=3080562 RepID=UPI002952DF5D|nr:LPS assembly protein LptD [Thioclava sp. A2]MDV7269835.1 LPS assembly protein LptD [Thioclava sp. A2]
MAPRFNSRLLLSVSALAFGLMVGIPALRAQDTAPASLLADRVILTGADTLVAEGNVEVIYQDQRLSASRVSFDPKTEKLTIEGPLRLVDPATDGTVLVADQAELSQDLQNGILTGARAVLSRELQLAAARIERREGKILELSNVTASSCEVCVGEPHPLWEIRSRKVTHNTETKQIIFESAQFRAMGVPLLYLPRLRMPDPTVERMSGFLQPEFRSTSNLGTGVKIPYFFAIDPSSDLTLAPYLSSGRTTTLEARYRRALNWGSYELTGALSDDSIRPGATRGYLFGDLSADLPADFKLTADLRLVSDDSYLLDYGITDDDRLWSGVEIERIRRDQMIHARIGNTHSIREGESNSSQPMQAVTGEWVQIYRPASIGGEITLDWTIAGARRASTSWADGADDDLVPDGRDRMRASMDASWRRNWQFGPGILARTDLGVGVDAISVSSDPAYDPTILRALPHAAAEFRWPWVAATPTASYVLEPVAQLVWTPDNFTTAPNEDSLLTEFDEGNLFSLTRFPGLDARERGLRANLGVSWTRIDANGWSATATLGRVFRQKDLGQFTSASSLQGMRSDWLLSAQLSFGNGYSLANRALIDDGFSISSDELHLAYANTKYELNARYLWLEADPLQGRNTDFSTLLFDGAVNFAEGWSGTFETHYDLQAESARKAALGLQYANECVTVDLSLSRRFTSSSSVEAETGFGISVALAGFGAGSDTARNPKRRTCLR